MFLYKNPFFFQYLLLFQSQSCLLESTAAIFRQSAGYVHFCLFKLLSNEVYSNYISPAGLFIKCFVLPTLSDLFLSNPFPSRPQKRHKQVSPEGIKLSDLFFCLCPPPPPPRTLCNPQLGSTCHYIVNHYVKIWNVRLGCK